MRRAGRRPSCVPLFAVASRRMPSGPVWFALDWVSASSSIHLVRCSGSRPQPIGACDKGGLPLTAGAGALVVVHVVSRVTRKRPRQRVLSSCARVGMIHSRDAGTTRINGEDVGGRNALVLFTTHTSGSSTKATVSFACSQRGASPRTVGFFQSPFCSIESWRARPLASSTPVHLIMLTVLILRRPGETLVDSWFRGNSAHSSR